MMKKLMIVAALLFSTAVVFAQEQVRENHQSPDKLNKEQRFEKMVTALELTPEQQVEVKRVMKESHEKRKELREKYPEKKTGKEEKQAAKQAHMKQMQAILTPEQFAKYKNMHKEHEKQMHERKRGSEAY